MNRNLGKNLLGRPCVKTCLRTPHLMAGKRSHPIFSAVTHKPPSATTTKCQLFLWHLASPSVCWWAGKCHNYKWKMWKVSQKKQKAHMKILKRVFQKSSHPTGTSKQMNHILETYFLNFRPYTWYWTGAVGLWAKNSHRLSSEKISSWK